MLNVSYCNILQHTLIYFSFCIWGLSHTGGGGGSDESQLMMQAQCYTLQHTATYCKLLQNTKAHCIMLQHSATHCNTLQHTATQKHNVACCYILYHTARHCHTLQHSHIRFFLWLGPFSYNTLTYFSHTSVRRRRRKWWCKHTQKGRAALRRSPRKKRRHLFKRYFICLYVFHMSICISYVYM